MLLGRQQQNIMLTSYQQRHFALINTSGGPLKPPTPQPPKKQPSPVAKDESEAASMDQAKEFLQEIKGYVDELNDYQEWLPKVMQSDKPVILDCYAEWCGPCKKLTPLLEDLTASAEGKFKLVKLNIDNLPQIATGLKVRNIPAVFLIHKGNVIDTFVGLPSEQQLKQFIDTAILVDSIAHDENIMQTILDKAEEFINNNELENAEKIFMEGYTYENWRDKFGPRLQVGIAYCFVINHRDIKKSQEILDQITEPKKKELPEFYKDLLAKTLAEINNLQKNQAPSEEEQQLIQKIENDPSDMQSRYDLAKLQFESQKYEDALESCLQSMSIQRNWNERAAYQLLLKVFEKLGSSNEVTIKARKRLSKILF
eukprot:403359210